MLCHRWRIHCAVALVVAFAGQGRSASAATLDIRVNVSSDDAQQTSGGSMKLTDGKMEIEQVNGWTGFRFNNVTIPPGAYIISAYVTMRSDANKTATTNTTIFGQNVDNATTFTTSDYNISSRARTTASVSWSIPTWSTGVDYNTPEVKTVVQEVVNRPGWSSGNSLAILIRSDSSTSDRELRSYNYSSATAPLLHVEYVVGQRPVATRLLFVVTNSASPTAQETARQAVFAAFGYTVTRISASASQATFDASAAANDLAYISEEITAADLNTKLKGKSLGVVNEKPDLADDFAVAAGYANPSGTAVTIASNTHFITSAFALGPLTITSSSQPLNTYSGTLAAEIRTVGSISSAAALCAVEINGKLNDGTRAAGRRVQMPWGGSSFDFNTLTPDGVNLLSRCLAWAGGVVGYWKLDESAGTTASDSTVNAKNGTLNNLSFSTDGVANAKVSRGLAFDGAVDYISMTNSSHLQLTKAMSMSAWIKGNSWGSGTFANVILRKGEDNPNNYQFAVENGCVAMGLDGTDGSNAHGNTSLTTGQWYHVVATWDGATIRFYVDGVADGTTARSGTVGTDTRPLYLGGRIGTDSFHGTLDDVRLYNHALSLDEITAIKAQGQRRGVRITKWVETP